MCLTYVFKAKFLFMSSLNNVLRTLVSNALLAFVVILLLLIIYVNVCASYSVLATWTRTLK